LGGILYANTDTFNKENNMRQRSIVLKSILIVQFIFLTTFFSPAHASLLFYDSFTGSGSITGHTPDLGGSAYEFTPPPGAPDTYYSQTPHKELIDGGMAYLEMSHGNNVSANMLLRETTQVSGINYTTAPDFYITFKVEASDFAANTNSHIDLITGIDHGAVTREHQVGIVRRGNWFNGEINPYGWGSDATSGNIDLGEYDGGMITMAVKYHMEPFSGTQYCDYVYAAVVSESGVEPKWIPIAYEANLTAPYELDFLRLELGISGHNYTDSGYIDEIKIGTTWADVAPAPVPIPAAIWLLGSGVAAIIGIRRKGNKKG
jgi:hypothetical protein